MTEYVVPVWEAESREYLLPAGLIYGTAHPTGVDVPGPRRRIGDEVHQNIDQFFRIEHGEGTFAFNETQERCVRERDAVVVSAGTYHNVINASQAEPLQMYTLYSALYHPNGIVHRTKAEAQVAEALEHS